MWPCGMSSRAIGSCQRNPRSTVEHDLPTGAGGWSWWGNRVWRCPDPDCDVASWSEQTEAIAPGHR